MKNVTLKIDTLRTARARAYLQVAPATIQAIREGRTPKADPLGVAKIAAIQAAKATSQLIPYCHQIPLDGVDVTLELEASGIAIEAHVTALWKTGVEMEALSAVSVAALTLYDMLKAIDKNMAITDTRLLRKTGGKSSFPDRAQKQFKAAVLVCSDSTAAGEREDKSGPLIVDALRAHGVQDIDYAVLPDDPARIHNTLLQFCDRRYQLILTTGGTGLGPRDHTVAVTRQLVDKELPAIAEAMRGFGQRRTPYAMLSQGVVGMRGQTIIINLPGSSKGTQESLAALFPALFHAYPITMGAGHDVPSKEALS